MATRMLPHDQLYLNIAKCNTSQEFNELAANNQDNFLVHVVWPMAKSLNADSRQLLLETYFKQLVKYTDIQTTFADDTQIVVELYDSIGATKDLLKEYMTEFNDFHDVLFSTESAPLRHAALNAGVYDGIPESHRSVLVNNIQGHDCNELLSMLTEQYSNKVQIPLSSISEDEVLFKGKSEAFIEAIPALQQRMADFLNDPSLQNEAKDQQAALDLLREKVGTLTKHDPLKAFMQEMLNTNSHDQKNYSLVLFENGPSLFAKVNDNGVKLMAQAMNYDLKQLENREKDPMLITQEQQEEKAPGISKQIISLAENSEAQRVEAPKPVVSSAEEDGLGKAERVQSMRRASVAQQGHTTPVATEAKIEAAAKESPPEATTPSKTASQSIRRAAARGASIGAVIGGAMGLVGGIVTGGVTAVATIPFGTAIGAAIGAAVGAGLQWAKNHNITPTRIGRSVMDTVSTAGNTTRIGKNLGNSLAHAFKGVFELAEGKTTKTDVAPSKTKEHLDAAGTGRDATDKLIKQHSEAAEGGRSLTGSVSSNLVEGVRRDQASAESSANKDHQSSMGLTHGGGGGEKS